MPYAPYWLIPTPCPQPRPETRKTASPGTGGAGWPLPTAEAARTTAAETRERASRRTERREASAVALAFGRDQVVHAVSSTGARALSGSHHSRWLSYQETVSARPAGQECSGAQPSSDLILVASRR